MREKGNETQVRPTRSRTGISRASAPRGMQYDQSVIWSYNFLQILTENHIVRWQWCSRQRQEVLSLVLSFHLFSFATVTWLSSPLDICIVTYSPSAECQVHIWKQRYCENSDVYLQQLKADTSHHLSRTSQESKIIKKSINNSAAVCWLPSGADVSNHVWSVDLNAAEPKSIYDKPHGFTLHM